MEYSLNSDLSGATQVSNPSNLTSLQPNTQYYYRAFAQDGTGTVNGNILLFTTSQLSAPTANAATAIQENQFTANWSAVDGASSYLLDVATTSSFVNTVNLPNLIISEYGEGSTGNKKYIEILMVLDQQLIYLNII
jgi:phosphodiesterase/alkaline phosphatase D-like protein